MGDLVDDCGSRQRHEQHRHQEAHDRHRHEAQTTGCAAPPSGRWQRRAVQIRHDGCQREQREHRRRDGDAENPRRHGPADQAVRARPTGEQQPRPEADLRPAVAVDRFGRGPWARCNKPPPARAARGTSATTLCAYHAATMACAAACTGRMKNTTGSPSRTSTGTTGTPPARTIGKCTRSCLPFAEQQHRPDRDEHERREQDRRRVAREFQPFVRRAVAVEDRRTRPASRRGSTAATPRVRMPPCRSGTRRSRARIHSPTPIPPRTAQP